MRSRLLNFAPTSMRMICKLARASSISDSERDSRKCSPGSTPVGGPFPIGIPLCLHATVSDGVSLGVGFKPAEICGHAGRAPGTCCFGRCHMLQRYCNQAATLCVVSTH